MENTIGQAKSSYLKQKINQKPISKFRETSPQVIATIATNILSIELGICIGFIRLLISYLSEENSEIHVNLEELTWLSSILFFLTPVGCILSGPIVQTLGRRRTLVFFSIPFSIEWIILYQATNFNVLMIGLGLIGITVGLVHNPIIIYVAEISKPSSRGSLLVVGPLSISLGIFLETISSSYIEWRTLTLINCGLSLIGFAVLIFIPESPHWLASTGHLTECERSLCWLRGWVSPDYVRSEYHHLCKMYAKRGYPAGVDTSKSTTNEMREEPFSQKLEPYFKRTFLAPLSLLIGIFIVIAFGGTMIVQTYATVIFEWLESPIEKHLASTILGSIELTACIIAIIITHFFGKQILILVSILALSITHFALAFYCFYTSRNNIGETLAYIPAVLLFCIAFWSQLGIKCLPHILAAEVFSTETRSMGTGLTITVGYVLISIANKIFCNMLDIITLAGTFLSFAIINLLGCIVLYFILPDTDGKSLQEIEILFATRRNNHTHAQIKKRKLDFPSDNNSSRNHSSNLDSNCRMYENKY